MRFRPLLTSVAMVALTACGATASHPSAATPSTSGTRPSAAATMVSTAHWVDFSWPAAGFAVKLPARPVKKTAGMNLDSILITMRLVGAKKAPHQAVLVADAHFSERMPAAATATELRSSIYSFAGTSGATITSGKATKFRGMPAYEALLAAPNGLPFQLIGFLRDPTDEIMVFAPRGAIFNAVTESLRLI